MPDISRRRFLAGASALGLLSLVPGERLAALAAPGPGKRGRFLDAHQLDTLRAVTGRLLPGPPDDPDPGAIEAGAAEAIDLLLGAFRVNPPLIHAGGPYSNRAGARNDDMAHFIALDPLAELGWRIRIEGSQGRKEREFAGPVVGLQEVYVAGLKAIDDRSDSVFGSAFVDLDPRQQDMVLRDPSNDAGQVFFDVALADCLAAVYGAPEYGGNRGLRGWVPINWPGDVQPRGFTDRQVTEPDPPSKGATPGPGSEAAHREAFARFLPAVAGRPQPREQWWLGRRPYGRG